MMHHTSTTKPAKQGSYAPYVIGFILSLVLTIGAYVLVRGHVNGDHAFLTHRFIVGVILLLAMIQLIVQLVFFLHLGREDKPRWNARVLMFAVLVVTILVAGSLWIMANLDYSHGHAEDSPTDSAIIEDEGFTTPKEYKREDTSH